MKEIHDAGTPNEENADIRDPAKESCAWVYDRSNEKSVWNDWRDANVSGIMLVTGGVGTGKSTLALKAIDALRICPYPRCVSASFCKNQAAYNSCEAILRGLLYGIVRDDREARDILVHHRDDSSKAKVGRDLNAFSNFNGLSDCFTKCVQVRKKELCLVIDGLDECEDNSQRKLLEYLTGLIEATRKAEDAQKTQDYQTAGSSPPLKILFLSRPINTILAHLRSSHKLDLQDVRKSDETRRILEHLVDSQMIKLDDTVRNSLISQLEAKSDGCIQWATLVVQHLKIFEVRTVDGIKRELKDLKDADNGLDDTYLTLFRRHFDKSSAEYANTALRIVAGAARPLSVDELANAMIVNPLRSQIMEREDFKKQTQDYRINASSLLYAYQTGLQEYLCTIP